MVHVKPPDDAALHPCDVLEIAIVSENGVFGVAPFTLCRTINTEPVFDETYAGLRTADDDVVAPAAGTAIEKLTTGPAALDALGVGVACDGGVIPPPPPPPPHAASEAAATRRAILDCVVIDESPL